jgi:hypothetical protein
MQNMTKEERRKANLEIFTSYLEVRSMPPCSILVAWSHLYSFLLPLRRNAFATCYISLLWQQSLAKLQLGCSAQFKLELMLDCCYVAIAIAECSWSI